VFHKVSLKPGKPLWFGVAERTDDAAALPTLVFGLPGNPVSTLVCFELFVRPALACLRGLPATGLPQTTAPLAADFTHRGYRPTYQPARWQGERIAPLEWRGSGDLRTLTDAEALVCFPAGDVEYGAGSTVDVLLLD
jgi:molybdopterin molybdotransferase